MSKSRLGFFLVIALLLVSLTVSFVVAQPLYGSKTTHITIDTDGTTTVIEASYGITYKIEGTPGASGDVTVGLYSGNPQTTASVPDGVFLNRFVFISFDMSASDFVKADITLSYSDGDVEDLNQPAIFKYLPDSDSYVQLYTTVDTTAKTMTATLTSVDDPILAIGGSTATPEPVPTTTWIIVVVSVVIIVVLAVFIVYRWRKM